MKSKLKPLAGALFLAMSSQAMVSADVLFDNSNESADGANYTSVGFGEWAASPFFTGETQCSPGCDVQSIVIELQADSFFEVTNFTDFHLEIYDDSGTVPGSTLIGTMVKTSPANIPIGNFTEIHFDPVGKIQLQPGTTYWLRFSNQSATEDPIAWEWIEQPGGKRAYLNGAFGLLKNSDQQYKMQVKVVPAPATGDPVPMIMANGSAGPVTVAMGQNLSVAITLDPANYSETGADWWVIAYSAKGGWVQYQYPATWAPLDASFVDIKPAYQGPLVDLSSPLELFSSADLPADSYEVYFGVDRNMNGILDADSLSYGSVKILVQ